MGGFSDLPSAVGAGLEQLATTLQDPEPMCLVLVAIEADGRLAPPATWPEAASRLQHGLRDYDELREIGPGWFALVLRTLAGAEVLDARLTALVHSLQQPLSDDPDLASTGPVIGVAIRHPQEGVTEFIGRALAALDRQRSDGSVRSILG